MLALTIILFILLVVVLGGTALILISPFLIGLVIILLGNGISKAITGRLAPVLWHIATVVVTIYSARMLWKDIFSEAIDVGAQPFIILLIYGLASPLLFILLGVVIGLFKNKSHTEKKQKKSTKRVSAPEVSDCSYNTNEDFAVQPSSRLEKLKKNLTVDTDLFRRYGIIFKCNLVEDWGDLQLNFELSNSKQLVSKIERDTDLILKANVYDVKGNLLCIEEAWIDYSQLRRGYAADYFYFSSDSIAEAHSIKVYAIDPTDDFED